MNRLRSEQLRTTGSQLAAGSARQGWSAMQVVEGGCAVDVRGGDDVCLGTEELEGYLANDRIADCQPENHTRKVAMPASGTFKLVVFKNDPEGTL